jgi:DNA-binding NarL/FixJ family response regulator
MTTAGKKRIRVLIIDDHTLFREGLLRLLDAEGDFEVRGCCATLDAGLAILQENPIDVVLLDFDLGLQRAFEFQLRAREEGLDNAILIVTAGLSSNDAARVLQLGARGIFVKHRSPETLAGAIRRVAAGEEWLDERYATLRQQPQAPWSADDSPRFSHREAAVLRGVFEGYSNKEIASQLGVSEPAIKAALQRLFQKTGVRTRAQLVRIAAERQSEVP